MTLISGEIDLTKVFHGYYVSPEGELYSLKDGHKKYTWLNKGRSNLYERAQFWIDGKKKNFYVHRIVAQLYLEDWDEEMEVDHINEDTLNNHYTNLKMSTPEKNKEVQNVDRFVYKYIRNTRCVVKQGTQKYYLGEANHFFPQLM